MELRWWILGTLYWLWSEAAGSELDRRPHFTVEPASHVVWAGSRGAAVSCRAAGHPQPTLSWITHDGQPLTTIPGLRHVLADGRLVLGARRSLLDVGTSAGTTSLLRCKATNRHGTILSRPVILQPVEDSVLTHTVRQLTAAREGGSVILRCEVAPLLQPIEVSWLQDGLPIPAGFLTLESRWVAGAGGFLFGEGLTDSDLQAEYICVAAGVPSMPSFKLTVDESIWLEAQAVESVEARGGDTVVLPCLQPTSPATPASRFSWQRQSPNGMASWSAVSEGGDVRLRGDGTALVFTPAHSHHAARYSCGAGASFTPVTTIKLTLVEPLTVTITPSVLNVGTGGKARFNCSTQGGKSGTTSWQHEGRPLHIQVQGSGQLDIGPVTAAYAGAYQCTAVDHHDTAVATAQLVISDQAPRLVSTFGDTIARSGQAVKLRCAAMGQPPPRIIWMLDDRPLPGSPDRFAVSTSTSVTDTGEDAVTSVLSISIKSTEEGGRYSCNATNAQGSQVHRARVNVFGAPYIRFLPPVHVTADSDISLHCPYSGYPIQEVTWKREDGTAIESTSSEVGELIISSIKSSAAGAYTCEVRADSGELARRSIHVLVHKPPKLAAFAFPEDVELKGSAQATCSVYSGDKPIHFSWLKDDLPIFPSLKVELKSMDFFSLLIIPEVKTEHNGVYTCRATNAVSSASHSAKLVVIEAPSWKFKAQNTSTTEGSVLLIPCGVTGQPPPHISWEYSTDNSNWRSLSWILDSGDEMQANNEGILSDGTIWVRSVSSQNQGWYRCVAKVPHHMPLQHSVFVQVNEPPRISRTTSGGDTKWVVRGGTTRLGCSAKGDPPIRLHWTHEGRLLSHGAGQGNIEVRESTSGIAGGTLNSELLVAKAEPENAGSYRCHAKNPYGSSELHFMLFVKERPATPSELRVTEVWSRKARLSWRISRARLSHYFVQYHPMTQEHHAGFWSSPGAANLTVSLTELEYVPSEGVGRASVIVSNLAPDTRYAVRAAAVNDVGASPFTTPLHFTTREEAPGLPPRDVKVQALRPRELQVSWQPPSKDSWHGSLLGYTVRWWEVDEDGTSKATEAAESGARVDATGATLRGLKPSTRYAVTVRAYNAAGVGPDSHVHHQNTLESAPSSGPDSIECSAGGPRTLRVRWAPPLPEARGGRITHYTLQYQRLADDPLASPHDAHLRVQGEEAIISRLSPYTQYEIRIRAHNSVGDGPFSAPVFCRTEEDVPSAPGGMKLIALSEKSLRASWLPPPEPNGRLKHYSLFMRELGGSEPNVTRINVEESVGNTWGGSNECMRAVRGLRAGRTYEAWVKAATVVGEGPASATATCQTSSLAPARISSFGGVAVGAAGASISLRCVVGGAPPPAKRWLRAGAALLPTSPFHLDGDALAITRLELSHADNYTCLAENPHGSDSATWRVIVLSPPVPPTITLLASRPRELELEVRPAPRAPGHAPPTGYTLYWKLANENTEWKSQIVSTGSVTLRALRCGAPYRIYANAGGPPGPELAARTTGRPPIAPADTRWIEVNDSAAHLDTSVWGDGGCGAVSLRLEWAGGGIANSKETAAGNEVVLLGLASGSKYKLSVRASNEAGVTKETYEFATLARDREAEGIDAPFPATTGELVVLLALCAALSAAAITILAILLKRKRPDVRGSVPAADKSCGTYRATHAPLKLPPEPPEVYEISPYATFAGPGGLSGADSRAYTLQLRALSRHEDEAGPPALSRTDADEETCIGMCEGQRRRRRRRHYCPDHAGCSQDSGS